MVQRWLYGNRPAHLERFEELSAGEALSVVPLLLLALVFGFYPKPIMHQTAPVLDALTAPARAAAHLTTAHEPSVIPPATGHR